MGYNTRFRGTLKFTSELTVPMLAKLNSFFGQDPREHPEWGAGREVGYIDLVLTKDFSGIEWDSGTEKTYGLERAVNVIIREMRKEFPDFGLTGTLLAQGEEIEDRWQLVIGEGGWAAKIKVPIPGTKIECPHCHRKFFHEETPDNGT